MDRASKLVKFERKTKHNHCSQWKHCLLWHDVTSDLGNCRILLESWSTITLLKVSYDVSVHTQASSTCLWPCLHCFCSMSIQLIWLCNGRKWNPCMLTFLNCNCYTVTHPHKSEKIILFMTNNGKSSKYIPYLIARTRSWKAASTLILCFALASKCGIFSCCARSFTSDGATWN